ERLADELRDADGLRERVPRLRRVEVEDDVVGPLRLVYPRVPGVHVDAVHLHHPDERGGLVDEGEVHEPRLPLARPGAKAPRGDPRRLSLRGLLVEIRLAANAIGIALERERPVAQVRDNRVADLDVVLGEVALRHAVTGEQEALRVRQPDAAPPDPDLVAHRERRVQVSSCRSGSRYRPARSGRTFANSAARSAASRAASELVVEYSTSSSSAPTVRSSSARSWRSGSNGEAANASSH